MTRLALTAAILLASIGSAVAERLVISLSNHRVLVTSNFTGEELVLFGTIEPDAPVGRLRAAYDIVVTVTGPRQMLRTRRKDRVLGIWVNTESRVFENVPSYLAVLSNRAPAEISGADTLRRMQLGLDNVILPQRIGNDVADTVRSDAFRTAFVQLQTEKGVYRQETSAVTFLTPTVFRTAIPLPAEVSTGTYTVDVQVFGGGAPIVRGDSALEVVKAGFEQYVATAARDHGLLYGLATILLAMATGWFASVIFRRD